jgi:methyl-accepting chemotaxis protein
LISVRILRPLQVLTAAAGQVAQGDLDVAVAAPRSRDEVGRLARAFQRMVEGLRQRDVIRDTFGRYVSAEVAGGAVIMLALTAMPPDVRRLLEEQMAGRA